MMGCETYTIRIEAPHFVAGVDVVDGRATHCAPILKYMAGWNGQKIAAYCRQKGWKWEVLS